MLDFWRVMVSSMGTYCLGGRFAAVALFFVNFPKWRVEGVGIYIYIYMFFVDDP